MRNLLVRIICLFSLIVNLSNVFAVMELEPALVYNQFPRVWNMNFREMKGYLSNIFNMGFNVVWVNPFFKTSDDVVVQRVDEGRGVQISAKSSLYAMYDPSLIYGEFVENSDGNPSHISTNVDDIKAYTEEANRLTLVPIFDLVINHVAKDSPLTSGTFSHFEQLCINTKRWFKKDSDKWDDVAVFDYNTEANRSEIFEHLWRPLIIRSMKIFGFQGVRIDYATGVNQIVLQRCIDLIKQLNTDSSIITFGEALIPAGNQESVLQMCRDTRFTNLTNLAVFLSSTQISLGKNRGYDWFLSDLGLKRYNILKQQQNTNLHPYSKFWQGTIGFSGSHDHGTTLQAAIKSSVTEGMIDNKWIELTDALALKALKSNDKLLKEIVTGKIIHEQLKALDKVALLRLAKERMAIAAFSSDAGWYFMAGDELLSTITKRPFITSDGGAFGGAKDNMSSFNAEDPMPKFVRNINATFHSLCKPSAIFWVEMFYLDEERNGMCFVRHLSEYQLPADIVVVNLKDESYQIGDVENIKEILLFKKAEISFIKDQYKIYFL